MTSNPLALNSSERKARLDMSKSRRVAKVPPYWWPLVESLQATANYDQETPKSEHTWHLVPVVAKPKAEPKAQPAPAPIPQSIATPIATPVVVASKATQKTQQAPLPTPPKPAQKPSQTAPTARPSSASSASSTSATKSTRKLDPRLPAIGVQNALDVKGVKYAWHVVNDSGRVFLSGGDVKGEEFTSVSSAAQRINRNIATNGYLFFGLGRKAT